MGTNYSSDTSSVFLHRVAVGLASTVSMFTLVMVAQAYIAHSESISAIQRWCLATASCNSKVVDKSGVVKVKSTKVSEANEVLRVASSTPASKLFEFAPVKIEEMRRTGNEPSLTKPASSKSNKGAKS